MLGICARLNFMGCLTTCVSQSENESTFWPNVQYFFHFYEVFLNALIGSTVSVHMESVHVGTFHERLKGKVKKMLDFCNDWRNLWRIGRKFNLRLSFGLKLLLDHFHWENMQP